jgi:membrane AbrB-like protein
VNLKFRCFSIQLATLGAGALGGWAFNLIGVPLPWLLGPLLTIGALSLTGLSLSTPWGSRQTGQLLLGTGIGLKFTLPVALFVTDHIGIMVFSALASMGFGLVAAFLLQRTARTDIATAYFSCVPGGVAEMSVQAERYGGESGPVALAQSLRVLCVVTTIPLGLTWLGATGEPLFQINRIPFDPASFPLLLLIGLVLGGGLARLRVGNAWMMGPLAGAALISTMGINLSGIPCELLNISQVLIGSTLGLRYRREMMLRLKFFIAPAAISTLALVGLNVLFGITVGMMTGLPISSLILSVAPGGMAEMAITAKVLGLAVPLVVAFQIVRIFIVIAISGLVFRHALRRRPPMN